MWQAAINVWWQYAELDKGNSKQTAGKIRCNRRVLFKPLNTHLLIQMFGGKNGK